MKHESRLLNNQGEANSNQLGRHRQIERDPRQHAEAPKIHKADIHQRKERLLPNLREEMMQAQEICHSQSTGKAENHLPRTTEEHHQISSKMIEMKDKLRNLREGLLLHKLLRRVSRRQSKGPNNRSLHHNARPFQLPQIRLGQGMEEKEATRQEENLRITNKGIKKLLPETQLSELQFQGQ